MKRIATHFTLLFALPFALGSLVSAQNPAPAAQTSTPVGADSSQAQSQPLGDYARNIHKGAPDAKTKAKIFDNDNLPTEDKISVVGHPVDANSAASAANAQSSDSKSSTASDDQAKKQADWKTWQDKVTSQKDQVDLASRELDVLQREYQLRAAEMYADAGNRLRNSGQWDKQDADYKQKIADKQKAVDEAKQKLQDMQEEGRKAGVPSSMME